MRATLPILLVAAACGGRRPAIAPSAEPASNAASAAPVIAASIEPGPTKPVTNRALASVGLDPDALDRTVDPCDDFYQFACGGWIAHTEIAADKPEAMRSFVDIEDRNLEYEHAMLEQARLAPADPIAQQLGTFYASCMDEAAIDRAGLAPLRPLLAVIDKVKDTRSLTAALGALDAAGFSGLFELAPVQDAADARNVIAVLVNRARVVAA